MENEKNTEKKTSLWMGIFVLVMSLVYILVSLGKTDWIKWIALIWGFFIAGFLFIQSGIVTYFRKKDYRKIGFGDVVVWITVGVAFIVTINSLLLIGILNNSAPTWLKSFSSMTGVVVGSLAGILAIVHMIMPRFK